MNAESASFFLCSRTWTSYILIIKQNCIEVSHLHHYSITWLKRKGQTKEGDTSMRVKAYIVCREAWFIRLYYNYVCRGWCSDRSQSLSVFVKNQITILKDYLW